MSLENILRKFSGVNHLKSTLIFRFIIGLVFVIYGFFIFYLTNIEDIWVKTSVSLAFWGLGLMFILDCQSILREYFSGLKVNKAKNNGTGLLILLIGLFFVIGTILLFIKFNNLENPSLYPMIIFLVAILVILIFQEKISHFELSKDRIVVKMKEDQEKDYENIESRKKEWGFKIEEVK